MKAAIIGASKEALHTIEKAHKYGLEVTALDGNPQAAGLAKADRRMVIDISDEEAVVEALKREKPDFLLTAPIGRYLTTVGAANDALGLPGISREMAVLCTDKLKFHEKLAGMGLRKCRCYRITGGKVVKGNDAECSNADADREEFPLLFPAILKPRYGSGSRGIFWLPGREELKKGLDAVEGEEYVLEECAAGEEYGVDGAVIGDSFQMVLLRRKENTPPPARQAVGYFSVLPKEPFYQQVCDYMRQVVCCLGLRECLLHADIIKTEDGPFVIELSARPSGHNLHNLFTPLCTGVDMAEEYIKHRMGMPCCFTPGETRSMMIHYFDMEGRVQRIPGRKQAEEALDARLLAWECHMEAGEELEPVSDGHSLMERGYFVLAGGGWRWLGDQAKIVKRLFFEG